MRFSIIEDRDGYVLVSREDGRYALLERRAGRFYSLRGGERPGVPCDMSVVHLITEEHDWVEEAVARAALKVAVEHQEHLAKHIW